MRIAKWIREITDGDVFRIWQMVDVHIIFLVFIILLSYCVVNTNALVVGTFLFYFCHKQLNVCVCVCVFVRYVIPSRLFGTLAVVYILVAVQQRVSMHSRAISYYLGDVYAMESVE